MLAAALRSGATLIVTANLADFPPTDLSRHCIDAVAPMSSSFGWYIRIDAVLEVVDRQAADLAPSADDLRRAQESVTRLVDRRAVEITNTAEGAGANV